jgi:hypothetical protein
MKYRNRKLQKTFIEMTEKKDVKATIEIYICCGILFRISILLVLGWQQIFCVFFENFIFIF